MAISPQVLPGRAFQATTPNSNLLFHWRAQGRSLTTVDRLSTGTLTRASAGGLTDGRGQRTANALTDVRLVGPAADNQPRWGVSTGGVPHLLLEDTRTNLMPISNPTTGWQVSSALSTGGETTVAPDGTLVTLLTDNSTTAADTMQQDVEVASTVAVVTWYTKWNGSTFGATHRMRLRDNTAAVNRGNATWEFGSTGMMTITSAAAGTVISAPAHIGNNWWKTSLECTAISTGNDNQADVRPADATNVETGGDMFISHIQVEDVPSTGLFASSHIPTVAAAVTRAAETLSWPFLPVPQTLTVYLSFIEKGGGITNQARLFQIGAANPMLRVAGGATGKYAVVFNNNVDANVSAENLIAPNIGDTVEIRVILNQDGSVRLGQSINGGGEVVTAVSSTPATGLPTTWGSAAFFLGSVGSAFSFNAYQIAKIMPGVTTLSQCREAF